MPWSERWMEQANRGVSYPRYLLEGLGEGIDARLLISSHDEPGGALPILIPEECSIRWGRLSLDSWTMGPSSLTITTHATPEMLPRVRPGAVFILRIGWSGWGVDEYETVWVGSLDQVVQDGRGRQVWSLTGLEGALHQRLQVTGFESGALFAEFAEEPFTEVDGTPPNGTTLPVQDNYWVRPDGGVYGLRLLIDDEWRYVTASAYDDVTKEFSGIEGALGLGLDAIPPDGTEVRGWAADRGHPIQIALRILTSRFGDGDNGDYDVYPRSWGLGIPADLVDVDDALLSMLLAGPSGAATKEAWWLHMEQALDSAQQWLTSWLAQGGVWICQRQGALTARALQIVDTTIRRTIGDDEIIDVRHLAYGGPPESASFLVRDQADMPGPGKTLGYAPAAGVEASAGSAVSETLRTMLGRIGEVLYPVEITDDYRETYVQGSSWSRPTQGQRRRDIPVWGTDQQREDWRSNVYARVGALATVRVQELEVEILGWDGAAPGDRVALDTWRVGSRRDDDDCAAGGEHIVIGGGPDFFGCTTQLYLIHRPPTEQG